MLFIHFTTFLAKIMIIAVSAMAAKKIMGYFVSTMAVLERI